MLRPAGFGGRGFQLRVYPIKLAGAWPPRLQDAGFLGILNVNPLCRRLSQGHAYACSPYRFQPYNGNRDLKSIRELLGPARASLRTDTQSIVMFITAPSQHKDDSTGAFTSQILSKHKAKAPLVSAAQSPRLVFDLWLLSELSGATALRIGFVKHYEAYRCQQTPWRRRL